MCGRITLRVPSASWCQQFLPDLDPRELASQVPELVLRPRYNIAPTQPIACVVRPAAGEPRQLTIARWGLVPSWSNDRSIGSRMINARSETVDTKRSYQRAFTSRRCLIPVDGYYEWMKMVDGKQPYLIQRPDAGVLAMAGLWEANEKLAVDGDPLVTCTVLTTAANQTTGQIHDRMPVFLPTESHDQWLDPNFRDVADLKSWLVAAPEDLLQTTAVSRRVNSVKYDDEQCIAPVENRPTPRSLFD